MKQEKVFALVKKPGADSEIRLINKDLKSFSTIVNGKREIIPFPGIPGVCIVLDGNAVASKKKPNCLLPEYEDLIVGTFVVIGINMDIGFVSLTEEQADKLEPYIKTNDAGGFTGDIEKRVKTEYLANNDDNSVYGFLSEVKTKYKKIKAKWLSKR